MLPGWAQNATENLSPSSKTLPSPVAPKLEPRCSEISVQKVTPQEGGVKFCIAGDYFGSSTVSITWITPFEAFTSAVVTFAPLTVTPIASAFTSSN